MQVRWQWLIFLTLELLLSAIFLIGTIVATKLSRMQIIKSSSLATMCALDERTRRTVGDLYDMAAVEEQAKKTTVKLETSVSGVATWLTMSRRQCPA